MAKEHSDRELAANRHGQTLHIRQVPIDLQLFLDCGTFLTGPEWRNWQTQQTQNLPELCSVWVRLPPPGHLFWGSPAWPRFWRFCWVPSFYFCPQKAELGRPRTHFRLVSPFTGYTGYSDSGSGTTQLPLEVLNRPHGIALAWLSSLSLSLKASANAWASCGSYTSCGSCSCVVVIHFPMRVEYQHVIGESY